MRTSIVYAELRKDPRWAEVMAHLEAEEAYLSRRVSGSIDLGAIASLDRSDKRAQAVAWQILGEIVGGTLARSLGRRR